MSSSNTPHAQRLPPTAALPRTTLYGDDVVFMYPATHPQTYADYGCTFLAWGGGETGEKVRFLDSIGVHSTGTLWCLTAGAAKLHNDPDLRDAVSRDIEGKPIVVWWLFDWIHEGTPTWFGCTNHPAFRGHVRQKTAEQMRGNAPGLHVDDHLGTAHTVAFLGGCFCDWCMTDFRSWLIRHATPTAMATAAVSTWDGFDYRLLVRQHASTDAEYQAKRETIPLFGEFLDFQLQAAAENVRQLGQLACEVVNHPITLSANTALPELPHVAVTSHLTHLVGEVDHHAQHGTAALQHAVHAYRMAEAIGKPLAATARGQDWAFAKANNATNLIRIWIALGFCAGQRLMAPHRQWCYTNEKGSHWYDAPPGEFAPQYRFVRSQPNLFRDTSTIGPLVPPTDVPARLDTAAHRDAFEKSLAAGNPQPLRSGPAWIFPRRRADGGLVVHVLNLAYTPDGDAVATQHKIQITIPAVVTGRTADHATLHAYDATPTHLQVRQADGQTSVIIPELRLWAVISIDSAA